MKRRFNYTNRLKIKQEYINLKLLSKDKIYHSFDLELNLQDFNFPSNAKIYIDAYHSTERKRYDFGTVNKFTKPEDLSLSNLAYTDNLQFRLLVVDDTEINGLILAHADRIKPKQETRKSILPVSFEDIGQQVWMIKYDGFEGSPILILNNKIPNIQNIAKSNPQFFLFVYPIVIREIVNHIIFIDNIDDINDIEIEWHGDWIKFLKLINPNIEIPKTLNVNAQDFDIEEYTFWLNKIVDEFCMLRKEWKEFIKSYTKEN